MTSLRSCRDWLSGDTTSVACGSLTYSFAMAVRRSSRGPISCTRRCWSRRSMALDVSTREQFDDGLQLWVALPHDFVQMRVLESCFLELMIGPAGVHGLMLTHVANEQHAILRPETLQKRVHLLCARQARFA